MKKSYIKSIIILIFLSLFMGQYGFCASKSSEKTNLVKISSLNVGGVDVKEFKKVKNLFHKKSDDNSQNDPYQSGPSLNNASQNNTSQSDAAAIKKNLGFEKTELDNSTFSIFEDESIDEFGQSSDSDSSLGKKDKKNKKIKEKKQKQQKQQKKAKKEKKNKKNKNTDDNQNQQYDENITEEMPNGNQDVDFDNNVSQDKTYINDTDIVYIKEVEVFGNNLVDTNYIKEQMQSKEGTQYVRSYVSNDLRALYNTGYFTQNIRALPIKIDDNNIKLRIILEENPPISDFGIVGNKSIEKDEIMEILDKYKGKPQNVLNINNAINEIQELYSTRGYILARVTKVQDDPDGYVNLLIDEGVIGDIIVDGNNKTKDFIVKRNIFLQPGSVYNENTMRADILRLMGTQAFGDVQRELKQDEKTGLYDVHIALQEQRTGKISLGVGIDSTSGFFGSVGFGENNFRGLGQKLNINLLAGTGILMNDSSVVDKANFQGEISFLEPMFKRENQSLALRGFARYYGSYQVPLAVEKRFGGEAIIARKFTTYRNLSGSLGFGVESVNLDEGNEGKIRQRYLAHGVNWANREKELDGGFYVKITPALTYDTRDSMMNARHGVLAKLTFEENLGISGDTFGKLHGMIRKFMPVAKKSSFVVTARAGGKVHGDMPDFAGFSLGGPYSIRGFNISEVGVGDGFMLGSAEFRTPIPFIDRLTSNSFLNNLRLAAFVDAGTLFNKTIGSKIYDKPGYGISAGVGLRVFIPGIGPINLDYGIPLTNTAGIDRKSGFFTFGMGEMY